ncbi:MAG: asparagine synthase-related protein [Ardenticatenaceae bacterium]|nr:asparagine synthase-related protein [Ardenticatenaceae bacterium]
MSGIFGLIHFDDEPVEQHSLAAMRAALTMSPPDRSEILLTRQAGFGQIIHFSTPESQYEALPQQFEGNNQLFTAAGRIDNRGELCDRFDISVNERATTPDSTLIWLAWQTWGEDCPDHLLGDWSFAVWNPQERRLFLARDHHGNTSLYYYRDRRRFAFASNRQALLALGVPRRLNELYLAQVLTSWPAYHGERTVDLDIYRLPPAHALTAEAESCRTWRYWRLEDTPQLHLPNFEAYVAGFLEIYEEAVRCRLRSLQPIGVTLSGGLDSGSVTALAAKNLPNQTLHAFTSVPRFNTDKTIGDRRFGDETTFAQHTARAYDNIEHHLIPAEHITPLDGLKQVLAIRQEPGHAGGNYYWMIALFQKAQEMGIGTLLTGQGGNATISWTGAPVRTSFSKTVQSSGWKQGIKWLMPSPLQRAYKLSPFYQTSWQNSAIHPKFAARLDLARQRIAAESDGWDAPYRWRDPFQLRLSIILPGRSIIGGIWAEMSHAFGVVIRDPTLDKRVMAYTLSIPNRYFVGQDGLDRHLIREAMAGLLPDPVRLNPKRGLQAADIVYRLRESADEIENNFGELESSDVVDYIDLSKMRSCYDNLCQNMNISLFAQAVTIFMRGLDTGLFLKHFDRVAETTF